MSSFFEWEEKMIAEHAVLKPYAPENGQALQFKVGDTVVYTNGYGVKFKRQVTGFYQPEKIDALYATGSRYLLDWDCPWFPVKECNMQFDEQQGRK
jgi:hypothetical protein